MTTYELLEELRRFECRRRDEVVVREKTRLTYSLNGAPRLQVNSTLWDYAISGWAMSQLSTLHDIPWSWLRKNPPWLTSSILNHWIAEYSKDKLGRRRHFKLCLLNGDSSTKVIGIVSNRYVSYPYPDFFEDVVEGLDGILHEVRHSEVNSGMFEASLTFPTLSMESNDLPLRRVTMGVHLRNSEVGQSSALVAATINDPAGVHLVVPEVFLKFCMTRMIHTTKDHTAFIGGVKELLRNIRTHYREILDLYMTSGDYTITLGNIQDLIREERLGKKLLDEHLQVEIFGKDTDKDKRFNLREVIEAISKAAQQAKGNRRWDLERIGGNALAMMAAELGI